MIAPNLGPGERVTLLVPSSTRYVVLLAPEVSSYNGLRRRTRHAD